ncbi:branched-chain amino acid transport system II carrier protein [Vagococcus hydrophili]|uniref:Branched-chain amino acid transport system carrier protein n=1 Tax=Vagococcus hydrophili TaxID=2714947 RepID=A0A6G8ASV8_9ENTE|nr:branched-chain amino acid transport system II carrier protein [Vagococcus hydrophili]QIL48013.1 branched-chain amino acid transport system II carrier protein [Vagococcus hydrophili]
MKNELTMKERLFVGSLIFGLFFGAGNLIFPIQMGQEAGAHIVQANLGFLITGIGLPFLGIIAFGLSSSRDLYELSSKVGKKYGLIFTTVLYLVIGPFFAMPRLASTSFEIALAPFLPSGSQKISLLLFSVLFFFIVWFFSRKPSKILDYVGKFLTPLFLVLLFSLLLLAFINPLGSINGSPVQTAYESNAFFKGFTDGYNTLDALAALAFGMIIIENIQSLGITKPSLVAKEATKSGLMGIILMGVIYTLLSFLGTMSLGTFTLNKNGGITLAQVAQHYLGTAGSVLLAAIVIVACLKTAIGLSTAFGRTFNELYPSKSYSVFTVSCILLATLIANVGLDLIIQISIPVLMFIYPLAMTLILMGVCNQWIGKKKLIFQCVTYLTMFAGFFDALNSLPMSLKETSLVSSLLKFAETFIPFFSSGLGWVTIALLGLVIGLLIDKKKKSLS